MAICKILHPKRLISCASWSGAICQQGTSVSECGVLLDTLTRKLRARGVGDARIKKMLKLRDRQEFVPDPHYLSGLKGFVSNRIPANFRIRQSLQQTPCQFYLVL